MGRNGKKWKEGTYKDGKSDGLWTYWENDGSKYEGGFYFGLKEDQGTSTYSNGEQYSGNFRNDLFHGYGTLSDSYGKVLYRGQWEHNSRVN